MDKELEIAFNSIPLFSDQSLDTVNVERLGGLTNRNFLIETSAGKYVLRLAGDGTDEYIDRIREKKNAEIAAIGRHPAKMKAHRPARRSSRFLRLGTERPEESSLSSQKPRNYRGTRAHCRGFDARPTCYHR